MGMKTLGPKFSITENNRHADVYDRGSHYTIECYKDRIWQSVMTTMTEEEAITLSNNFVMETK